MFVYFKFDFYRRPSYERKGTHTVTWQAFERASAWARQLEQQKTECPVDMPEYSNNGKVTANFSKRKLSLFVLPSCIFVAAGDPALAKER